MNAAPLDLRTCVENAALRRDLANARARAATFRDALVAILQQNPPEAIRAIAERAVDWEPEP